MFSWLHGRIKNWLPRPLTEKHLYRKIGQESPSASCRRLTPVNPRHNPHSSASEIEIDLASSHNPSTLDPRRWESSTISSRDSEERALIAPVSDSASASGSIGVSSSSSGVSGMGQVLSSSSSRRRQRIDNNSRSLQSAQITLTTHGASMEGAEEEPLLERSSESGGVLSRLKNSLFREREPVERTILFSGDSTSGNRLIPDIKYPANVVRNQKYSVLTFLPVFLYEQFRFFFNLYFLLVALSQFVPVLQVGFLFTYIAPLAFVLSVTMIKELYDDFARYRRDAEANSAKYERLTKHGVETITSSQIRVGDLLVLHANNRVPADCVLLRTHDKSGAIFIRTDQLDGETDWKLRNAIPSCQKLPTDQALLEIRAQLNVEAPKKQIYEFLGNFQQFRTDSPRGEPLHEVESLGLENTLWTNTVIASGTVISVVVYTGKETRSALNANKASTKVGQMDEELNTYSKILFIMTIILAFLLTGLKGLRSSYAYILFFRFVLLFSSIIPISMRVNLDLGKTLYSILMMRDSQIQGTTVRNSTIPEELGRISYLFSDKTGTLTRNEMQFKVLQMEPPVSFNRQSVPQLAKYLKNSFEAEKRGDAITAPDTKGWETQNQHKHNHAASAQAALATADLHLNNDEDDSKSLGLSGADSNRKRVRSSSSSNSKDHHRAYSGGRSSSSSSLSLSKYGGIDDDIEAGLSRNPRKSSDHGYSDSDDEDEGGDHHDLSISALSSSSRPVAELEELGIPADRVEFMVRRLITALALCHNVTPVTEEDGTNSYQAASPDEVALVKFTESVGLTLIRRTAQSLTLRTPLGDEETYEILQLFPFTSETRRMGIIVRRADSGEILFYLKGAESIMKSKISPSEWLEEEVDNLARVGLRTLVVASRVLTDVEYADFVKRYNAAKAVIKDRDSQVQAVVNTLERQLDLLGLTGVEDRLQDGVKSTLETLRNAGLKVWMLTGDKAETAICIGISARLIDRGQPIFQLSASSQREAANQLDRFSTKHGCVLVIDGPSLQICLDHYCQLFLELACESPSVICCRCSPTQKAQIVSLMKNHTKKRTAAIGDGGNDVSMILAADVGIGIVGKEGKQASLAADFSVLQFSYINRLILWHGRNSYKRSARLSQFVIHRGLIISVIQAVFSALFFYASIPIFNGWLMVGYATFYTMFPVFSLVLDEDVDEMKVFLYPELYLDLQKGRPLSAKTFWIWVFKSVYQGGVIMILAIVLFESKFLNIVSITFTALILSELVNVLVELNRWHPLCLASEVVSVVMYIISLFILKSYFDITFIFSATFAWKVTVITAVSCLPPAVAKIIHRRIAPSAHSKVNVT